MNANAGGNALTMSIPSSVLKQFAGRALVVTYSVKPLSSADAGKTRTSYPLYFEVRGLDLPAPAVLESTDDAIDPDRISNKASVSYATVSISYEAMAVGDTVRLVGEGVDVNQAAVAFKGGSRDVTESNVREGAITMIWEDVDIKLLLNGTMTFYYLVYREGVWYTSRKRTIYVGPQLSALAPYTEKNVVINGCLDPATIIGQWVDILIPSAGTVLGDKVTLFWRDAYGENTFIDRGVVTSVNVNENMKFDIPLNSTVRLSQGKLVTVYYKIERALADGKKISFNSPEYQFFVGSEEERSAADNRILTGAVIDVVKNGEITADLANTAAKLIVPFAETRQEDNVTAYWQLAEGGEPTVLGTQTVDEVNVDLDLVFDIPASILQAALNKKAFTYYIIERKGFGGKTQKYRSQEAFFSVGPQPVDALLPAPQVNAAVGGMLDPLMVKNGTTVIVAVYPTIALGDEVTLFFGGEGPMGTQDIPAQVVTSLSDALKFDISGAAIGFNIGKIVWVFYEVARKGLAEPILSESTLVKIQRLGPDDLEAPVISQASEGVLDLGEVQKSVEVKIKAWPFIAAGQRVWLSLQGVAKDGSPLEVKVWTAKKLTDAEVMQDLTVSISRSEFENFMSGSEMKVSAQVAYDEDFNDAYASALPPLILTIRQFAPPQENPLSVASSKITLTVTYPPTYGVSLPTLGATRFLEVSGGAQPYSYESSDESVVYVYSDGLIMAIDNGSAIIEVKDSNKQVVSVEVTVRGVAMLKFLAYGTYSACKAIADSRGLVIPSVANWRKFRADTRGMFNFDFVPTGYIRPFYHGLAVWTSEKGASPRTQKGFWTGPDVVIDRDDLKMGGVEHFGYAINSSTFLDQ
ncbi:hypothetical protein JJQ97_02600 [Pseudomonas syringae]|uniref:hypothetical protein n=1 Tax=Pseudomonas syringae TaxID=317 RepID=UPI0019178F44|nr:hypothetical protein [Pseudomonas syringae]QQQ51161.1 hypothetical protein JJQ97_02600 [Pseudomonas syringae]